MTPNPPKNLRVGDRIRILRVPVSLIADDGETEEHTLMVYDDGTWEKVTK